MKIAKIFRLVRNFELHFCFGDILGELEVLDDVLEKCIWVKLRLAARENFLELLLLTAKVAYDLPSSLH